ncbi:MAG TPA: hypothetical protein VF651_07335 [Gammaproteobacteria bacterium]
MRYVKGMMGFFGLALLGMAPLAGFADVPPSMVEVVSPKVSLRLVEDWWQWAESVPLEKSPIQDETGADCAQDQQGPVWFLAGGYGTSKIHRACTIPAGKSLFFPIINMVYFPGPGSTPLNFTCADAQEYAELDNDTAMDLFASVDGVSIEGLKRFRVSTHDCFDIFARLPEDQQPYSGYPSATDGFWLMLKPLSKGRHLIKFGGRYNSSTPDYGHMIQDIEYELTVE